jgi:SAM-dependent methyltransferase
VVEPWRFASERTFEFDRGASDYHRLRPRYPETLFDDIVELAELPVEATAIEIGAGTGIATGPLTDRGMTVTAIEPAPAMAAVGQAASGEEVRWIVDRFEDWEPDEQVDLVAAFNSWHWLEPELSRARVADTLRPGGAVALVWTEVVAWGNDAFEARLADAFGAPWPKAQTQVLESRNQVAGDGRFGVFQERRHRFERTLDAKTFAAVARTYGGRVVERDETLIQLVNEVGGHVTKIEEAVLYIARRR